MLKGIKTMKGQILLLLLLINLAGCSLFTKKGNWGRKAFWPLKGSNISDAFKKNISSPHVWIPAAGASVIWAGNWDKKISDWIYDENIFFDNHDDSDRWSDSLDKILVYEMNITPLFTASSQEDDTFIDYAASKTKGYLVIAVSGQVADHTHNQLTKVFKRQRPGNGDHRSFPSGHSTKAGSRNVIISKNLDAIPMNEYLRYGIKTVNTTAASLLLWSRVEAKAHYPTDVLMGYSLGAFVSGFLYDSLMNMDPEHPETVSFTPMKNQWALSYTYGF